MNGPATTPEVISAPKAGALPDIIDVAIRHRGLVITGLLLGIAAGVITYLKLGPAYETKSRILVSKKGNVQLSEDDGGNKTLFHKKKGRGGMGKNKKMTKKRIK